MNKLIKYAKLVYLGMGCFMNENQQELLFKESVLLKEMNKTKINILDINNSLDVLLDKKNLCLVLGMGK